jgi:PIN domain nuclease of toxin-antitoxin system
MASVWEIAIKHSRGMLSFQQPFMEFIRQQLTINRMELLPSRKLAVGAESSLLNSV